MHILISRLMVWRIISPYLSNTEHWTKYACSCKGSRNGFRFTLEIKDFCMGSQKGFRFTLEIKDFTIQISYAWTESQRWYGFCPTNEESIDEHSICAEQINFNKMQVVNVNLTRAENHFPWFRQTPELKHLRLGLLLRKISTVE